MLLLLTRHTSRKADRLGRSRVARTTRKTRHDKDSKQCHCRHTEPVVLFDVALRLGDVELTNCALRCGGASSDSLRQNTILHSFRSTSRVLQNSVIMHHSAGIPDRSRELAYLLQALPAAPPGRGSAWSKCWSARASDSRWSHMVTDVQSASDSMVIQSYGA